MGECSTLTEKIKDFYSTFFWFSIPRSPLPPCIIPGLSPHRLLPPPQLARQFLFHCSPIVLFCVRTRLYALVIFCFSFPSLYPMLRYDVRTDPISLVCFSLSRCISVSLAIRNSNSEPISLLVPLHVISLKESHYNRVRRVIVRQ